jgi:zinc transporter ZupT
MPTPVTDQLFTSVNIASVGTATAAVTVLTNTLYKLAKLPQKWTAFVAALLIAYIVVSMSSNPQWYDWILAFFNACLLYCSALGINQMLAPSGAGFAKPQSFFQSWLKP